MLATFVIEATLAIYVGLRYSSGIFRALVCTLLICLGSFQLAEYCVCVGPAESALSWGKLGLAGITLLPALGMHLISSVTRKSHLVAVGYSIASAYILLFMLAPGATGIPECGGNYVILKIGGGIFGILYEAYYFVFVVLAILELALRLTQATPSLGYGFSKKLIALTLTGYLTFTVPMAVIGTFSPDLRKATPSIMCGFALGLAIILAVFVAPLYAHESLAMKKPASPV
ncbi:MAG TPA: hypothetical protein VHE55_00405 [Fimbriimonadaceae bacterium]|nr:hypothetical protein [Fimbriimonadaceae bacterium]